MRFLGLLATCFLFGLVGCAAAVSKYTQQPVIVGWEDELRDRAAFEFHCELNLLKVTPLGSGNVAGVEGCSQKGVYVRVTGANGGAWMLNSDEKPK